MATDLKEAKCVIWDLDNTLWDGTLLESGSVTLKPGIEEILQVLDSRGILHSIASKNNHEDAVGKLRQFGIEHYFLYPEIHWNPKSVSVENIQRNLNVGIDSLIFIDDQSFERDEVQAKHPAVDCIPAWDYRNLLTNPRCNPKFITEDSSRRRLMYKSDSVRKDAETAYQGTPEEFLSTLNMVFTISRAEESDLQRVEELTVRTHQLNSTGATYDYDELDACRKSDKHRLFVAELEDKYGTYGKIGLALTEITDAHWHIKLLLMSCRVMSRGVGSALLVYILREAKKDGKKVSADFVKTERNRMMYVTYKFANFVEVESDGNGRILLENDLSIIPPHAPYIDIRTLNN